MRYPVLGALLLLCCGLLPGCSSHQVKLAADEVVARAPDLVAPAERYQAEISGLTAARVETLCITGTGVRPDPNLVLDPLTLILHGVDYQLKPFQITNVADATFKGRASQSAVNHFVRQQHTVTTSNIQNIQVAFEQNLVKVTAVFPVYGVDIPIAATGAVRVDEGIRLNAELKTFSILTVGVPKNISSLLMARINPLVDLSGLRFKPRLDKVTIEPGGLVFSGKATLRNYTH